MTSQKLHRDPFQVKFWNAQQGGMGCLRATSALPTELFKERMGEQPPRGMCQRDFCTWRSGSLKERTLKPLSILCPSWELTVEGPRSRRQTFQITQLPCGSWHITCCINADLKSPIWEEFCPYKAIHVVEQLLWLRTTSLSGYLAVDTFMEVGI